MSEQKCHSVKCDCEECGADVLITVLYPAKFRDFAPLCPFCHHPLTLESKEETIQQLEAALAAVKEGR